MGTKRLLLLVFAAFLAPVRQNHSYLLRQGPLNKAGYSIFLPNPVQKVYCFRSSNQSPCYDTQPIGQSRLQPRKSSQCCAMELSSRPGSYHCGVLAFMLSVYNLNVVPSLGSSVEVTANFRDVALGASPLLTCEIFGTSPSRFVSWTKTPLPSSSSVSAAKFDTITRDSKRWIIRIRKVTKSGTYFCNAESNGISISDHVFIRVIAPPVIAAHGATALEGSPATLICNSSNYDYVSWNFRGSPILDRSSVVTLNFHQVSRIQNGTYECVVEYVGVSSYAYPNLIVHVPPEVTEQPESTTVRPGESGEFTCSIAGSPRPHVAWMTGNDVLKNSSRTYSRVLSYTNNETRSQLTIRNATAKDDGSYYCSSVGGAGDVRSKLANLIVEGKKIGILTAKSLYYGGRGVLQCINGTRDETHLVTWRKDHGEIDFQHQNRLQMTQKGNLVIDNVTFFDAGTYECRIRVPGANTPANFSQKINVTVLGPPSRPNDVRVSILGKSQRNVRIHVNWTRPSSDGNIDLMGFIVYYRLKSPLRTAWKVGINARDSRQLSARINADGLDSSFSSVVFEIKVEAVNMAGLRNSTLVLGHLSFPSDSFSPNGTASSLTESNSSAEACRNQPNIFLISCSVALWFSPCSSLPIV
ncbi:contactin-5-like isoform X2 [Oscarella lobularis]|uniref:contactin-5-like isoform X2 n=1 Tax=Oscarella lobularis TaxID=121494 RepID=UPI0033134439